MHKKIHSKEAPKPIGPYEQGILATGSMLFISGQIPINPSSNKVEASEIRAQTTQVLKNILGILRAANAKFEHVVKTTVFLQTMEDFPIMNEVYNEYFKEHFPARTTVQVSRLPKDVLVEIEAIAMI